jgi:hypothetical protein
MYFSYFAKEADGGMLVFCAGALIKANRASPVKMNSAGTFDDFMLRILVVIPKR